MSPTLPVLDVHPLAVQTPSALTANRLNQEVQCERCGCTPSQRFTFRHRSSFLVVGRRHTVSVRACRECALALGRRAQNKTLTWGWWGRGTVVTNAATIAANARELRRAARLDRPQPAIAHGRASGRPMSPGRPLVMRLGMWILPLFAIAATAITLLILNPPPHIPSMEWKLGACTTGRSTPRVVTCGGTTDGRVVAFRTEATGCSATYVETSAGFWCVDLRPVVTNSTTST